MIRRLIAALFLLAPPLAAMPDERTFFAAPQEAVPALAGMLVAEDWPRLARCYLLDASGIDRSELESGRYFRRVAVTAGHPAGLDRWRHPFPPGYRYLSHAVDGDEALVRVGIEIDQGGGMVQRGWREFRMRKTAPGWQVLPDRADSLVRQWTAAALRAHVTRARATLDRPEAEAESSRLETLLAAEPRARAALADRLAEVERMRGESAQEVQRLALERQLLAELEARLTAVPRR